MSFVVCSMALLGFGVCTGYALGWCHRGDVEEWRR